MRDARRETETETQSRRTMEREEEKAKARCIFISGWRLLNLTFAPLHLIESA